MGSRWRTLVAALVVASIGAACTPPSSGGGGSSGNLTLGADCTATPVIVAGARLAGCDLGAIDLSGLDLTGIDLRGANLAGANLTGTNLTDADLSSANLSGANLSGANLTRANLSAALLFGTLLVGAILFRTMFHHGPILVVGNGSGKGNAAPADGVAAGSQSWNDRGEPWCDADFTNVRSTRTNAGTDFSGATFTDPEIQGLDFRTGNFSGATLDFRDSPWYGCLSMHGGHFQGTTFVRLAVQHWDITDADLRDAVLIHAYLCESDLSGSNLAGAQLIGATNAESCADYSSQGWPTTWPHSLSFVGANLTGARIGGNDALAQQYTSGQVGSGPWSASLTRGTSGPDFTGATLDGLIVERASLHHAETAGTTPAGASFTDTDWRGAHFDPAWSTVSTTWSGWNDFDQATCPDGSTGSFEHPCFENTP